MSDLRARYAPYLSEINACACNACNEVAYALSSVLDGSGSPRHLDALKARLAQLEAGNHLRMSYAERAELARKEKAERIAEATAEGRSESYIAALERGYVRVSMRDFYATGMGLGIGPRARDL